MKRLLALLLAVPLLTFCDTNPAELATTSGSPSALVEGCVSAITGQLYIQEADISTIAAEPITISREYLTQWSSKDKSGWKLPWTDMITVAAGGVKVSIKEPSGCKLSYGYVGDIIPGKPVEYELTKSSYKRGLVHAGNEQIHSVYHCKNNKVTLSADRNTVTLVRGNGEKIVYELTTKGSIESFFRKSFVQKANGNILRFDCSDQGSRRIFSYNPSETIEYSSVEFVGRGDKKHFEGYDCQTNHNRTAYYRLRDRGKKGKPYRLGYIDRPYKPNLELHYYSPEKRSKGNLLKSYLLPNLRQYNFSYYVHHHNKKESLIGPYGEICSFKVKRQKDGTVHPLRQRIQEISAPVGRTKQLVTIARFLYYFHDHDPLNGGYTDVLDAYRNLTRYHYNKDLRLDLIEHFERSGNTQVLRSANTFTWGGQDTPHATFLLSKQLLDHNKELLLDHTFNYDDQGNLIKEVITDKSGTSRVTQKTYSTDGRNLLLEKIEPNGLKTSYTYLANTNLPLTKFITGDNLTLRHFYTYNDDNILICEVTDNGTHTSLDDLTGVTERHIKRIASKKEQPFINMPETVQELYLDLNTQQEHLLSQVTYEYTPQGDINKEHVYDAQGKHRYTIRRTFNKKGWVLSETDPLGHTIYNTYDDNGNVISTTDVRGITTHTTYDHSNRPTTITCDSHTIHKTYDFKHNVTSETNPLGNTTKYEHDCFGNITSIKHPTGNLEQFTYDSANNRTLYTDSNGHSTTTTYNGFSQPLTTTYPDGTTTHNTYNPDGTLCSTIDQNGTTTTHTYDVFGRITSTKTADATGILSSTSATYNAFHLLTETDAAGFTTHYTYDDSGRLASKEREGHRTEYIYDALGNLETTITRNGNNDLFVTELHDLLGRIIEKRSTNTLGKILSHILYKYDSVGNLLKETHFVEGNQATTLNTYDAFNRLTSTTNALGHTTTITYNESTPHLQKTTTDPLGRTTTETYDVQNRLMLLEKHDSLGNTIFAKTQDYDLAGNCISQTDTVFSNTECIRTVTTLSEYDSYNRLTTLIEAANTSHERTTHTTYTPTGLVLNLTKPSGIVLTNTYDPFGNLLHLQASDDTIDHTFTYNALHQVVEATDSHGTTTITRDPHGNPTSETLANGYTLTKTYDNASRLLTLTLPDNSSIHNFYNPLHMTSVTRRTAAGDTLYTHRYNAYDLSGNLLSETHLDNTTTSYHYNLLGTPIHKHHPTLDHQLHTIDPIGNLLSATLTTPSYSDTVTYTYDPLNQLTSETGLYSHTYLYDSHHNRLSKNDEAYQYNALHQATHELHHPDGYLLSQDSTYDALGRLISIGTNHYTYDPFHRRILINDTPILYNDQHELGTLETLRVLGPTPNAEIGATIAVEASNIYTPHHDLYGNLVQLTHNQIPTETYHFTAFGEEYPFFTHTPISPWRFSSKRIDPTNLIYFGRRYYNPQTGRFITPDPKGYADGPNLYAYVHNSPLLSCDPFGLEAEHWNHFRSFMNEAWDYTKYGANKTYQFGAGVVHEAPNLGWSLLEGVGAIGNAPVSVLGGTYDTYWKGQGSFRNNVANRWNDYFVTGDDIRSSIGRGMHTIIPADASDAGYRAGRWTGDVVGQAAVLTATFGQSTMAHLGPNLARGLSGEAAQFAKHCSRDTARWANQIIRVEKQIPLFSKAGRVMDRGGLTKAGRALQKHGGRHPSVFPNPKGSISKINQQGQNVLDLILSHQEKRINVIDMRRYGTVINIHTPLGGVRFKESGEMMGLLQP